MKMRLLTLAITAVIIVGQGITPETRAKLAPTGTLRAAFLGDNPALGRVNPQTGEVTGPVADIVKELARRIGVPFQLIPASGARDITNRLQAHTADMGFMAYNAGRARDVDFTEAWLMMPNSYIVTVNSPIRSVADADRAGVVIGAVTNDTQDVFLTANLKNATLKRVAKMPEPAEIAQMLEAGGVAAFAANRQRLVLMADQNPQLRVAIDDYFSASQAIALPKDQGLTPFVDPLVNQILATPLVHDSIERAGLKGVYAAKPNNTH